MHSVSRRTATGTQSFAPEAMPAVECGRETRFCCSDSSKALGIGKNAETARPKERSPVIKGSDSGFFGKLADDFQCHRAVQIDVDRFTSDPIALRPNLTGFPSSPFTSS